MSLMLIDTNVLVYAHDRGEYAKQQRAIEVLAAIEPAENGRLSVQCLGEFYSLITRGQRPRLGIREATLQVERFARSWKVMDLTPLIVLEALRGVREHQLSYWDAQVWATARLNQVPVVLTEDIQSSGVIEGVKFVNPFAEEFAVEEWT